MNRHPAHHHVKHGVTLVELMVVLLVLGVILALAAPSFADMLNRRRVQAIAEQIATDMAFARAEAGLRSQAVAINFRSNNDMNCYTMHYWGGSVVCDCRQLQTQVCVNPATAEFKTTRVPTNIGVTVTTDLPVSFLGGQNFRFSSPQLTADPGQFSITVTGTRGATLALRMSPMGRVRTCTPNSSVPGVAACD